jgi:hypothetical protein
MKGKVGKESSVQYYARHAERVIDNGYEGIVSVLPGTKQPRYKSWTKACFAPSDEKFVAGHTRKFPSDGIGIACGGRVIGIDIDETDEAEAHRLQRVAFGVFGETPLIRVGRWPKRMLVYRVTERIDSKDVGKVQVIAAGRQFVALGTHPDTGKPYYWLDDSPAEVHLSSLPVVTPRQIEEFAQQAYGLVVVPANANARPDKTKRLASRKGEFDGRIVHDADGRVIDGREAFLTRLIFKAHQRGYHDPEELARAAWREFCACANLTRPKGNGRKHWSINDARKKAKELVRKQIEMENGMAPSKRFRGLHPSQHTHSLRRPDYWTVERKREHMVAAASLTVTPSLLIVNQAMLDAITIDAGQCTKTVGELAGRVGLAEITVKEARRALVKLGLWIRERGVYVPVSPSQKGMDVSLLYRNVGATSSAPTANDNLQALDRLAG